MLLLSLSLPLLGVSLLVYLFMVYLNWFCSCVQEKRLRVNMRLKKLQEKVKEQQEKVGEKVLVCRFQCSAILYKIFFCLFLFS